MTKSSSTGSRRTLKPPPEAQRRILRIPLRRRAIENPNDSQLVFWARTEGALQKLSPSEVDFPMEKISPITIIKLRKLYTLCLEKWKNKEQQDFEEFKKTVPSIHDVVREFFEITYPSLISGKT